MKKAIIFGITGQDGSYLSELLLKKNYEVHGVIRRSSSFNTGRINHLYLDKNIYNKRLFLHYGDITDTIAIDDLIKKISPNEIYNLAAQSHVKVSFEIPLYKSGSETLIINDSNLFCLKSSKSLSNSFSLNCDFEASFLQPW